MARKTFVLNGPNLDLPGQREPGIYGGMSLATIETACCPLGQETGFQFHFRHRQHEGVPAGWNRRAKEKAADAAINPRCLRAYIDCAPPRDRRHSRSGGATLYIHHSCPRGVSSQEHAGARRERRYLWSRAGQATVLPVVL